MPVGEDGREVLSIVFLVLSGHGPAVDAHGPRVGGVEAGQQLHEGCLAASVAAGHDDQFFRLEHEVEGAEGECLLFVAVYVGVGYALELE